MANTNENGLHNHTISGRIIGKPVTQNNIIIVSGPVTVTLKDGQHNGVPATIKFIDKSYNKHITQSIKSQPSLWEYTNPWHYNKRTIFQKCHRSNPYHSTTKIDDYWIIPASSVLHGRLFE